MTEAAYRVVAWTEPLYAYVRSVAALTDEALLDIGPRGLYVRQTDPAHVAMMEATLWPSAFQGLGAPALTDGADVESVVAKATYTLGVDFDSLKAALTYARRRRAAAVALELRSVGGKGDRGYELSVAQGGLRRSVRGLPPDDLKRATWPSLPYGEGSATAEAETEDLRLILGEAVKVSDHVCLRAFHGDAGGSDRLRIEAPYGGEDFGEEYVVAEPALRECKVTTKDEKVHSHFPLDYLANLVKACPGPTVALKLGIDYPITFGSDIERRGESGFMERVGHVTYLLAPRIDTSSDEDHPIKEGNR